MLRLVVGFLPWIILAVLGERSLVLALVLALAVAAATTFRQLGREPPKILDSVSFAFFAYMIVAVVAFRSALRPEFRTVFG